jgi:hypothetical protein
MPTRVLFVWHIMQKSYHDDFHTKALATQWHECVRKLCQYDLHTTAHILLEEHITILPKLSQYHFCIRALILIQEHIILFYCIIPNTPRGGVTGNEMGDMVVSNQPYRLGESVSSDPRLCNPVSKVIWSKKGYFEWNGRKWVETGWSDLKRVETAN